MPLGDHLRAHQNIGVAFVHLRQLALQRAFAACAVGVDARHPHGRAIGAPQIGQQFAQMLFKLFGAAPDRCDVDVAAIGAAARHRVGVAAVMAAQRAVELVKDAVGAAVCALALPAAVVAGQHRRIATPVQKDERLLPACHAFGNGLHQGWCQQGAARLLSHVQ